MFVLTVDQVDSRRSPDRVGAALDDPVLRRVALRGPDRTAGDEFQLVVEAPDDALGALLHLTREGGWSAGLGVGAVRLPLPPTTREGAGDAFTAARAAVEAAKRSPSRAAVASVADPVGAADATALLQPLLELRARRSPEGWRVADLLAEGLTQRGAAERLGITPQAVSLRARAGALRVEEAAVPALVRILARLDAGSVAAAP